MIISIARSFSASTSYSTTTLVCQQFEHELLAIEKPKSDPSPVWWTKVAIQVHKFAIVCPPVIVVFFAFSIAASGSLALLSRPSFTRGCLVSFEAEWTVL
jgi:hypothetical protein